jgi:branched-subunit amino acid permease
MSGFIALSIFLAKMTHCTGAVCWAARMDAFFVALGYAVWAAAAVIAGIEISNGLKQDREALKAVNEVKNGA